MAKILHINNIETTNNKVTSIDRTATDEQYPSAKAVYEMLSSIEPGGGTSEGSCSNTFIEEGVSTWAELNDTLAAYDKNFTNGGSVTVYLSNSFLGVEGYYNIKRMMDTLYEYVATDISNPAKNVYKFNRKNYTYEFIGNESFELKDGDINNTSLFSEDMRKTYFSLPVVSISTDDVSDTYYNSFTTPGVYQIDSNRGVHQVLIVLKPNSTSHLMQILLKYDTILYRGIWCTLDGVYAADDWEPWNDLTDKGLDLTSFDKISALADDADPYILAHQTTEPSARPTIKIPLSLIKSVMSSAGISNGDIDSKDLFSLDMQQKYLSYPKYQHSESYSINYDTLLNPGIYQASTGIGAREVVIVMAPSGTGGYGSGWTSDSEAHRFQIKLSHEKIEYRSCWANDVTNPDAGDWTDWSLLNSLIDMGMINEESGLVDKTYNSEVTYTFRSNGSWGLPTGNYMAKLAVNSNTILEVAPFIYRGKSYQIDTDGNNWSITEVTPT